ncbi:MAG: glycoside hydrolase family 99-like domain-containing protein [Thermoguttaceae bacterium]|jgi:hypothetical protein
MKKNPLSLLQNVAFLAALICFALVQNASFGSEPKTLFSWDFDTEEAVKEWGFSHLTPPTLHDGALKASATSWDPFIVSPHFMLKPRLVQYIEIRMRSTFASVGEIFFASSDEGQYNGFTQEKTARWTFSGDGQFHTYQITPSWLYEPQIIKIRVDFGSPSETMVAGGAEVEVDYVRIIDIGVDDASAMERTDWNADELATLKTDLSDPRNEWISEIGKLNPDDSGSNLYLEWSKVADVDDTEPFPRASLRCLVGAGSGSIHFESPLFNLCESTDAYKSTYSKNVDLTAFEDWGAPIFRWELSTPRNIELKRVAFSKEPIGPGVLETQDGRQSELVRIHDGAASAQYETIVRNCGGGDISNFTLSSTSCENVDLVGVDVQKIAVDPLLGFNPTGDRETVSLVDEQPFDQPAVSLDAKNTEIALPENLSLKSGEAFKIVSKYSIRSAGSFNFDLMLRSSADGKTDTVSLPVALQVLPAAKLPENVSYVPEPQDVESDYEIGAFYFPGWSKKAHWDKIDVAAPIRKPLLGYYDESNPEVVDWQIKWAAENGIKFFLVDWYWLHGQIRLDHWVNAFQRAKYRSHLKWAVMWANHTGFGTHSTEDWTKVTKFWIDNYFKTPEYYTIDGKPVVVIWQQDILDHDMIEEAKKDGVELKQGEGCKRALDITRKMCEEAGLPGVYFIAMKFPESHTDAWLVQELANGTFDGTSIYHFMYPGEKVANPRLYSFDEVVDASKPHWEERRKTGILPFLPNISTGWDSRPWHGFRTTVVYGRSVASFKRLLEDYKSFADETGIKRAVLGPLNEWGEGSYIEPNNEYGFGMYEAIREVLCKEPEGGFPVNYTPKEIGLGPYDFPLKK